MYKNEIVLQKNKMNLSKYYYWSVWIVKIVSSCEQVPRITASSSLFHQREKHTEIERKRKRDRQTCRQTETDRDRQRHRETERDIERDRQRLRERQRDRKRKTLRERQTDRYGQRETERHRERERRRERQRETNCSPVVHRSCLHLHSRCLHRISMTSECIDRTGICGMTPDTTGWSSWPAHPTCLRSRHLHHTSKRTECIACSYTGTGCVHTRWWLRINENKETRHSKSHGYSCYTASILCNYNLILPLVDVLWAMTKALLILD